LENFVHIALSCHFTVNYEFMISAVHEQSQMEQGIKANY
jgi:hypothetical protein